MGVSFSGAWYVPPVAPVVRTTCALVNPTLVCSIVILHNDNGKFLYIVLRSNQFTLHIFLLILTRILGEAFSRAAITMPRLLVQIYT